MEFWRDESGIVGGGWVGGSVLVAIKLCRVSFIN